MIIGSLAVLLGCSHQRPAEVYSIGLVPRPPQTGAENRPGAIPTISRPEVQFPIGDKEQLGPETELNRSGNWDEDVLRVGPGTLYEERQRQDSCRL